MTPAGLTDTLDRLGLNQSGAAAFLDVDTRTVRRWQAGEIPVPAPVTMLLRLMVKRGISAKVASGMK